MCCLPTTFTANIHQNIKSISKYFAINHPLLWSAYHSKINAIQSKVFPVLNFEAFQPLGKTDWILMPIKKFPKNEAFMLFSLIHLFLMNTCLKWIFRQCFSDWLPGNPWVSKRTFPNSTRFLGKHLNFFLTLFGINRQKLGITCTEIQIEFYA